MKVTVVGAGIGGLATAVALRRVGAEVTVFERASELKELGAGLGLYPNAMKALKKLGLREAVLDAGQPLRPSGQFRTWRGNVLLELPTDVLESRFGDVAVGIHRAELHKVLREALEEAGGKVRLSSEFSGFEQDEDGVTARFVNGTTEGRAERADLLVGSDGLHSAVRRQLLGDGPPRYAGYVAWRGLVEPAEEFLRGTAGFEAWACGGRFGLVALGRGRAYWFATKNSNDSNKSKPQEHKPELLKILENWHEPVPSVIRATEEIDIHYDAIYYREPAQRWGEGRATLLGDAAHPMTPDLGQGACQAIEDAVVLADCLRKEGYVTTALRRYEALRTERTSYVVRQSLRSGRVAQLGNPLLCGARDALLKVVPSRLLTAVQLKQMEQIVAYEP